MKSVPRNHKVDIDAQNTYTEKLNCGNILCLEVLQCWPLPLIIKDFCQMRNQTESLRANYTIQYFFLNFIFCPLEFSHFILRSYCIICLVFLVHVTLKPSRKSSKSPQLACHLPKTELLLLDIFPFKSFNLSIWHDAGSLVKPTLVKWKPFLYRVSFSVFFPPPPLLLILFLILLCRLLLQKKDNKISPEELWNVHHLVSQRNMCPFDTGVMKYMNHCKRKITIHGI